VGLQSYCTKITERGVFVKHGEKLINHGGVLVHLPSHRLAQPKAGLGAPPSS
jgi:hypothetical protein